MQEISILTEVGFSNIVLLAKGTNNNYKAEKGGKLFAISFFDGKIATVNEIIGESAQEVKEESEPKQTPPKSRRKNG